MARKLARPLPDLAPGLAARFDQVTASLVALCAMALRSLMLEAGRTVIDQLHGGDEAAYVDRDPNKTTPFGLYLAVHGGRLATFGLDEPRLRKAVKRWIVWRQLAPRPQEVLGVSMLVALYPVWDPTVRAELALQAVQGDWTVVQLEAEVAQWQEGQKRRGGRPRLPAPVLTTSQLARQAEGCTLDPATWQAMTPKNQADFREYVRRVKARVAAWETVMGQEHP